MSGASDKARFYMEQAVPQLREFEEKKIFSKVRSSNHKAVPLWTLCANPSYVLA